MPNRKERRKELVPTRIQTKFIYKDRDHLASRIEKKEDGRSIAYIELEGYASTRVKDGSGDVVEPQGIDLSRFEAGNAPLKAMHGRTTLSNVGVIKSATVDPENFGLYIKAETRLDVTKNKNGNPIVQDDYILYTRLKEGIINGFSIGFHDIKERFDEEKEVNVIYSLKLHEISIVDIPDNPLTLRKMLDIYHEQKEGDFLDDDDTTMDKTTAENASEEVIEDAVETTEVEETEEVIDEVKIIDDEDEDEETDEDDEEESSESEDEKSLSQESNDSGKAVADDPIPETEEEVSDEGTEDKSLETESKLEKALAEKKELEDALVEAKDMFDQAVEYIKKQDKEIEKLKKVKIEHGLHLTDAEAKNQVGNVAKALDDGKKMY